MRKNKQIVFLLMFCSFVTLKIFSKTIEVSSQEEFIKAQSNAVAKDIILWLPGTYKDIYLNIYKDNITVKTKFLGKTIFTGASKALIRGNGIIFKGFQYINGNIGSDNVISLGGSHINMSEINISHYISYKYLYVKANCQYNQIYKCNFEKRINIADKNILSIRVSDKQPGFHKIQYCSFRNFEGTGQDMGVEPIRIGTSSRSKFDSKTIVEYCYFTECNGDGELISNKAGKNILRYNTFENNPLGELVLRHGSNTYVYGNFFLKGKGGIRIKEGSNHYIFNNYFSELSGRSISVYGEKINPIRNVYIMNNTFVNTSKLHLGGNKTVLPKKLVLANNFFVYPNTTSVGNASGKEQWIGNMFEGKLGITINKGFKKITPYLSKNEFGFYELTSKSSAVNGSKKCKVKLPIFKGLDVDSKLNYDIVKNKRPDVFSQKDVGCVEFSVKGNVLKPFATSENTGPSYETAIKEEVEIKQELKIDQEIEKQ